MPCILPKLPKLPNFDNIGKALVSIKIATDEFQKAMQGLFDSFASIGSQIAYAASGNSLGRSLKDHPDMQETLRCPACVASGTLYTTIQHINDFHEWSREEIADWLDTLPSQPIFYPQIEEEETNDGYYYDDGINFGPSW